MGTIEWGAIWQYISAFLSHNNKNHGQEIMFTTHDSNVVTHRSTRRTNPTDQSHERPTEFLPSEKPCNRHFEL